MTDHELFDPTASVATRIRRLADWLETAWGVTPSPEPLSLVSWVLEQQDPVVPLALIFNNPALPTLRHPDFDPADPIHVDSDDELDLVLSHSALDEELAEELQEALMVYMALVGIVDWPEVFESLDDFELQRTRYAALLSPRGEERWFDDDEAIAVLMGETGADDAEAQEYLHWHFFHMVILGLMDPDEAPTGNAPTIARERDSGLAPDLGGPHLG